MSAELTPIELECNMGKDINGVEHREPWKAYDIDEVDALIAQKDFEIDRLKEFNAFLKQRISNGDVGCSILLDDLEQKDKEIAKLKADYSAEVEKLCIEKTNVDTLEQAWKRSQRALWITRTATAKSEKDRWNAHIDCGNRRNRKDPAYVKTGKLLESSEWRKLWADIERKCRAKAEEYK